MGLFYGWGSTVSRLAPLRGSSLLFTTNSPEIPGSDFIDLGRMKSWVDLGDTRWFWTWDPWIGNPASYPLGQCSVKGAFIIANITNFSALPPAERVGGHCGLAFLLLVVLLSITDLDMMYFLRKIFPPSHVLEICIYSHLQCFLR